MEKGKNYFKSLREEMPEEAHHPVLFDTVKREHYTVVGTFYNDVGKRTMLIAFREADLHYITLNGCWDAEQNKLYCSNRFLTQALETRQMSSGQRYTFNVHYMNLFIDDVIYISKRLPKVMTNKKKKQSQINMDI